MENNSIPKKIKVPIKNNFVKLKFFFKPYPRNTPKKHEGRKTNME